MSHLDNTNQSLTNSMDDNLNISETKPSTDFCKDPSTDNTASFANAQISRINAICSLIEKCDRFADIGCDHGFISRYVLQNNLASTVIAADISPKCLKKAQKLLGHYPNIQFVCNDGLKGITANTIVIAGLGGLTIMEILQDNMDGATFILQPQDHAYELRNYVTQNGYEIQHDFVVKDSGRFYDILLCRRGQMQLTELEAEFGVFYLRADTLLVEKLEHEYKKFSAYNDGGKNDQRRAKLQNVLSVLQKIHKKVSFDA